MRARIEAWLTAKWYQETLSTSLIPLLPVAWLFRIVSTLRRLAYRRLFPTYRSSLPVIVVGNITVGGTGKTPFVQWLMQRLQIMGMQPGVILRGVGKRVQQARPIIVTRESKARDVGDEALLLAKNSHACVVVSSDRGSAARMLEQTGNCNIIISDDGLQHYALQRDIEIVLVDAKRQFGNQYLLPAGPLREPISRLNEVDFVVENGVSVSQFGYAARYVPQYFVPVIENISNKPLNYFRGKKVHAVAAIGHPQQFFAMLKELGLDAVPHIFPDHHLYTLNDLSFNDELPIVMTEKDAVKCRELTSEKLTQEKLMQGQSVLQKCWYLAVQFECDVRLESELEKKLALIS